MDMLVLFPLEFLANKPVLSVLTGKDVTGLKKGPLVPKEDDRPDVKAKPRLEKTTATLASKARH